MRLIFNAQTADKTRTAKVYRDTQYNEFQVKFYDGSQLLQDATYFTDNKDDAINTAQYQLNAWSK